MDRFEDNRRFLRIDLAGTVAAAVVNFSMGRPKEAIKPADFFEAAKPKRINRRANEAALARTLEMAAKRFGGVIVKDKDGNVISGPKENV